MSDSRTVNRGDRVEARYQTLHDLLMRGKVEAGTDRGEVYRVDGPLVTVDWDLKRGGCVFYESSHHKVYEMDWDEEKQAWLV